MQSKYTLAASGVKLSFKEYFQDDFNKDVVGAVRFDNHSHGQKMQFPWNPLLITSDLGIKDRKEMLTWPLSALHLVPVLVY